MTEDVLHHISLKLNQRRARKPIGVAMAFASATGVAAAAFYSWRDQNVRHSSPNLVEQEAPLSPTDRAMRRVS